MRNIVAKVPNNIDHFQVFSIVREGLFFNLNFNLSQINTL